MTKQGILGGPSWPEPSEERVWQKQTNLLEHTQVLEGECRVESFVSLQPWHLGRWLLTPLLSILTCLILPVILLKSVKWRSKLLYRTCSEEIATHLLIYCLDETMDIEKLSDTVPSEVTYRKVKYFLMNRRLVVVHQPPKDLDVFKFQNYLTKGLTSEQVNQNQKTYGLCQHLIEIPTLLEYLFSEMTGLFFILQYAICAIYILEGFYMFAAIMIGMSIITTILNYYLLRLSLMKVKEMAERKSEIRVLRDGQWQRITSEWLVPGDVYVPQKNAHGIPCDSILASGQVYMNEASLTGETVPIGKFPPTGRHELSKDHVWLYEGSEVLQSRGQPLAVAVYTGFITRKGRIIRKIMYREDETPEFFLNGMFFLFELLVACCLLYFILLPTLISRQISQKLLVLRFFDLVGWVLPPTFPIFFNLCYSFSLWRLRQQNIYGTQSVKTIISGRVKAVCFDKTGTLTENLTELHSIIRMDRGTFDTYLANQYVVEQQDIIIKLFASCHTVRKIDGKMMGDELDLRMFLFSHFDYELPNSHNNMVKLILKKGNCTLQVLHINQFESKFQSMSVLVREVKTGQLYIFVKGAPQKMQQLAINQIAGYNQKIENLSLSGLRSLGFGYKLVNTPAEVIGLARQEFEKGIFLMGLVGFQNKLKPETRNTILKLRQADCEVRMITGDNIFIGLETAIRSGIIEEGAEVIVLQGHQQGSYEGELVVKDGNSIKSKKISLTHQEYMSQETPIIMDNAFLKNQEQFPQTVRVFARISPQNKARIVKIIKQRYKEEWQKAGRIKRIFNRSVGKVAMVGDGANDILAIKESDVGIGISDTDSSFAANFTIKPLSDVETVLRQGKSTLTIIMEIFRYYVSISILKYTASMIMSVDASSYSDLQFTYFNYMQTLEIVIFLCLSHAAVKLSRWTPNDNFLTLQNQLVIWGHSVIPTLGLLVVFLVMSGQEGFQPNPVISRKQWVFECHSNTAVFLSSQLFYILNSVWIYTSFPWKQPIFRNIILSLWLIIVLGFNLTLFFITPHMKTFFGLVDLKFYTVKALGITFAFAAVGLLWSILIKSLRLYQK